MHQKFTKTKELLTAAILTVCLGAVPAFAQTQNYNAAGAVNYAEQWSNEVNPVTSSAVYENGKIIDYSNYTVWHKGIGFNDGSRNPDEKQDRPAFCNPAYIYYGKKSYDTNGNFKGQYGYDCANFVAQCLKQGGIIFDGAYPKNDDGHIINCAVLHGFLRNRFKDAQYYEREISKGYDIPSWLKPGDVVIWWAGTPTDDWKKASSQHVIIVVTEDKLFNGHTSNRWHREIKSYKPDYATYVSFYQIPTTVSNARPQINLTIQNNNENNYIRSNTNQEVKITITNINDIGINNIKLIFKGIAGEPEYSDNDTPVPGFKFMTKTGDNNYNYEAGSGNRLWWKPSENWNNKWVKFVVVNTRGYDNDKTDNPDYWNPNWIASEYKYVKVVSQNADLDPKVSWWQKILNWIGGGLGLRSTQETVVNFSNSMYDVQEVAFGDRVNIFADANGYAGNNSWEDYDRYVGVIYGILANEPQFTKWDEPMYNGNKFGAYHADDVSENYCYFFTPETRSEWEGRYAKIIVHNDMFDTWSEPRYIKIIPTLATLTVSQGTLLPTFDPDVTSYTVNVANSVTSINISATANSGATTIYGRGNQNLNVGTNTFTVSIVGVNGSGKTYTVTVNRAPATCKTPPDYDLSFIPDETWNSKDWGASINSSSDCKVYRIYGVSGAMYDLHIDPKGSFDPVLILYNSSGNQIGNILDAGGNGGVEYHQYQFTYTGYIYAQVKGYSSSVGQFDFSCRKTPLGTHYLTVSPETYNFAASGGTSSAITVTSNQSWTVSDDASWLTTSLTSGSNNNTFTMTATANTSTSSRSATVTVSGGGLTQTISVTQDAATFIPCKTPPDYDKALATPTTSWQTHSSSIQSGGCYVYRVSVISGQKYTFKTGCGDGATADFATEIFLYDNSGNFLTWVPDGGCESGRTKIEDYQFNYTGYAYIRVKGFGAIGETTTYGNYTLAFRQTPNPPENPWQIGSPNAADITAVFNNGTLTISGTGTMQDWNDDSSRPWYSVKDKITNAVIDNGVTTLGNRALAYCNNLAYVSLPNTITTIGDYAFDNCTGLTSINIPNSVTTIGNWAFSTTKITSINIPNSVAFIGREAFGWLSGILTDVTVHWGTPLILEQDPFAPYTNVSNINLHIPDGTYNLYAIAPIWKDFFAIYTAIDKIDATNFKVHPNPVKDELTIERDHLNMGKEIVQIIDFSGRIVIISQFEPFVSQLQIKVSNLSAGTYIVKIGSYTSKFVKK